MGALAIVGALPILFSFPSFPRCAMAKKHHSRNAIIKGRATKTARLNSTMGYSIPTIAMPIMGAHCPTSQRAVMLMTITLGVFPDSDAYNAFILRHGISLHCVEENGIEATYRIVGAPDNLNSLLSFSCVKKLEFEVLARVPNIQKTDYPHGKLHESQKGSAFSRFIAIMQKTNRRKFAGELTKAQEEKKQRSAALLNWRTNPDRKDDGELVSAALANKEIDMKDFWEIVVGAWIEDGSPMK